MSRALSMAMVTLLAATVVTSSAEAQRRRGLVDVSPEHYRRGFWLEGAIGMGGESFAFGNEPYTEAIEKPTVSLRIGGTVNPNLRLGAEFTTWWDEYYSPEDDVNITETLTHLMAIGRIFPAREIGLFGKVGGGLAVTTSHVEFGNTVSETGFGGVLGAGYEIKVSPKLFITPAFDYYVSRFTERNDDTLKERLWNVSIGVTWQPGR